MTASNLSATSIELMNAVAGPYFRDEGLDGRLIATGAGSLAITALASGHATLIRCNGVDLVRAV
ncbi:MAG TPA: hypothetical protein VHS58_08280, partial [Acetobacteraceae bacterium]|nr:hypothetical protein [Acetobacteraceae bacterium]